MGILIDKKTFTYDDILIIPQLTRYGRENTNVSMEHGYFKSILPIIPSPMDTVINDHFSEQLREQGLFHWKLFTSLENEFKRCSENKIYETAYGITIFASISDADLKKALSCFKYILIDSSHGHSSQIIALAEKIAIESPNTKLTVGNIVTARAFKELYNVGVRSFRIGIGASGICTTRLVTGHGYPQASAVYNIHQYAIDNSIRDQVTLIADGGIVYMGDIAKAIACGADYVMMGRMFAECSGSGLQDGKNTGEKVYRGMGSTDANSSRYGSNAKASEGVSGMIVTKYPLKDFCDIVKTSLQAALFYSGCENLYYFREDSEFIISDSAKKENSIRVNMIKNEPNYSA